MWWPFKKKDIKSENNLPKFIIEMSSNGDIIVHASWPKSKNPQEILSTVRGFIGTLLLMNDGSLIPIFQQAIALYAKNYNDIAVGQAILAGFASKVPNKKDKNKPIIKPSQVFQLNHMDEGDIG